MSTTFTWSVETLDRLTADGIVYQVHYTIAAADDTYQTGGYGSMGLDTPAEDYTVVPYSDLTEEVVIGWVKAKLGEEQVSSIEAALQSKLDELRAPSTATGTPWS